MLAMVHVGRNFWPSDKIQLAWPSRVELVGSVGLELGLGLYAGHHSGIEVECWTFGRKKMLTALV